MIISRCSKLQQHSEVEFFMTRIICIKKKKTEIVISTGMLQNRTLSRRSHPGEKKTFFEGKKQVGFLICFSSIHIFPPTHTNILAVLCLTGATAESIIQPVSKTSHHISAEGGKKKGSVPSPNQFGSWNSTERVCGRMQQRSLQAR